MRKLTNNFRMNRLNGLNNVNELILTITSTQLLCFENMKSFAKNHKRKQFVTIQSN